VKGKLKVVVTPGPDDPEAEAKLIHALRVSYEIGERILKERSAHGRKGDFADSTADRREEH
jgi:hypothetical protein